MNQPYLEETMPKLSNNSRQRRLKAGVDVVNEASPGGMRKIRSPLGHQLAVPMPDGKGGQVLRTQDGRTFVSKKI